MGVKLRKEKRNREREGLTPGTKSAACALPVAVAAETKDVETEKSPALTEESCILAED